MAPQTKKRSSDPEALIRPTPRRRKESPDRSRPVRPSLKSARFRQSTLTQIVPEVSFLSRGSAREDSDEEDEERARRPTKRRRRRIGPSQKTLTQIGWINPLRVPYNDDEEEDEGELDGNVEEGGFESEVLPSDDDEYDHVVAVEENEMEDNADEGVYGFSDDGEIYQEPEGENRGPTAVGVRDTPQTPRRHRRREIPSSQTPPATPLTPWSVLRKRMKHNERSPLKALSTNSKEERRDCADMPPPKLSSPLKRRSVRIATNESTVIRAPALLSERTHVSDSQDLSGAEEEDLEVISQRGVAIGEETQAMIYQIDAACGPDLIWEKAPSEDGDTPQKDSRSGNSSQASRSFNFDEENDAGAAPPEGKTQPPSPTPARKSPILGGEEDEDEDADEEEDKDEDAENKFLASSFPTPQAPPPSQASQVPTQTQEPRSSQPFALQHPSQVSTVAETTQATPPRATPRQRHKSRSQLTQTQPTPRQGVGLPSNPKSEADIMWCARSPSQATTTNNPTQSQLDRIPESPLRPSAHYHASSTTATPETQHRRLRGKQRKPPALLPSSPLQPPAPLPFTSSPASSPAQREASNADGYGNSDGDIDRVISATQMLPASLMDYSMPRPPAGWDASSVGWVRSSMPEEVEDDEGEED